MRMTVVAIGSRGDVEPLVALGAALRRAGHQVRVATSSDFEPMVRDARLDFAPVGPSTVDVLTETPGRKMIGGSGGLGAQALRLRRLLTPIASELAADLLAAVEDADGVLFTQLVNVGDVAEQLGIPSMLVALWPKNRTAAFPAVGFPRVRPLGAAYNRITHLLLEQLSWRPFQHQGNRIRRAFGQAPLRWNTPLGEAHKRRQPVLYGFSDAVVPRPADWGPWLHVTGYWFKEPEVDWSPPEGLGRFLADGEPPVVVTFGSMTVWDPARLARTAIDALALTGRRGVLVGAFDAAEVTADRVHHVPEIPHRWLFPKAAAVVHHAGAGTAAAALRAGVPSVTVPFFGDQPFWARQVAQIGAGPEPIRRLSTDRLAAAIGAATTDARIRENAARVGRRIRDEDGLGRAVQIVEQYFTRHART